MTRCTGEGCWQVGRVYRDPLASRVTIYFELRTPSQTQEHVLLLSLEDLRLDTWDDISSLGAIHTCDAIARQ